MSPLLGGVAWRTAHVAYVAHQLARPLPAVEVLGIDETRRDKPVWKQDEGTGRWVLAADRWHTGFVDADGTGGDSPRSRAAPPPWRPG